MPVAAANAAQRPPLFAPRKIVHISMLVLAFLFPILPWVQAAGCAVLVLLFNVFLLPQLSGDSRQSLRRDAAAGMGTGVALYPISVVVLILLYRHHLHVAAAAWAIMALGDGMASVSGEALRGPTLPWNRRKTWTGFAGFVAAGTVGAYVLTRWVAPGIPGDKVWMVSAAGALVGALVETVPIQLDDNVSVPLVTGAFIFCAYLMERTALASNWPYLGRRIILALIVNACFATLALVLKTVSRSGAAAGMVLGTAVYLGYGYKSFLILFAFFLLGSMATRMGYAAKARRGVAERRGGARGWREALANTLAGAFFSILVITSHHEKAFLVALVAAFAEAAGDTVSSEIGQWISERAYLITTLRPVPAGVDGGISAGGTLAGLLASALVAGLGYSLGLCGIGGATIALAAAFTGNLLDSLLGATVEQRGLVTNGIVNFAGTSFAGGLALALTL
ncbi:MAG: DUF92 domain-containing protein [Acidobacteriia bacterium]|nr:DUF92 domain-containing protein [Terriglobia bacterium]